MRQNNSENEKAYVWHDGVRICDEQLVKMAMNAGSYTMAEHYLCSLLIHGNMYGIAYYINKVNEVRAHYGLMPIPVGSSNDGGNPCNRASLDDMARKMYNGLKSDKQKQLLKDSLLILITSHRELFKKKVYWIAIYLVIRDRIDSNLSKTDFTEMAIKLIPKEWPIELVINDRTLSNFARYLDYEDRFEPYYDMDNNPWDELCDVYWDILKQLILT